MNETTKSLSEESGFMSRLGAKGKAPEAKAWIQAQLKAGIKIRQKTLYGEAA